LLAPQTMAVRPDMPRFMVTSYVPRAFYQPWRFSRL